MNRLIIPLNRFLVLLINVLLVTGFVGLLLQKSAMAEQANTQLIDWLPTNLSVANDYILPRYAQLKATTKRLNETINTQCQQATKADRGAIIEAFANTQLAWAGIEHINIGPIIYLKRIERFNYWPDKHRVGRRQIQRYLSENAAPQTTDNGQPPLPLANRSVAIQGLSALEQVLFSKDSMLNKAKCDFAQQITANLLNIATIVSRDWSQEPLAYKEEFELAEGGESEFTSSDELASVLANTLLTQLTKVSEVKIGRAFVTHKKDKTTQIRAKRFEAWRSAMTLKLMVENLSSLKAMYTLGLSKQANQAAPELNKEVLALFDTNLIKLKQLEVKLTGLQNAESPFVDLLAHPETTHELLSIQKTLRELDALIRSKLLKKLRLNVSFNALDGD